jgi:hypothetical protein
MGAKVASLLLAVAVTPIPYLREIWAAAAAVVLVVGAWLAWRHGDDNDPPGRA